MFLDSYGLSATLTALGGGPVIEAASAVVPIPLDLAGDFNWYGAVFTDAHIGQYQLNVYKLGVLVLAAEVGLLGPLASSPITGNATYNGVDAFDMLYIDHLFHGQTRVWWSIAPEFADPGPYVFVLQASYAGHADAVDWVDVTLPQANVSYLVHVQEREQRGKDLLTHFRVVLTTAQAIYVSAGYPIWGNLPKKDHLFARELARKENLRLKNVCTEGYLLRRLRYGVRDTSVTDALTLEIDDTTKSSSWGTAFEIGYHPPTPLCIDMSLGPINATRGDGDVNTNNSNVRQLKARFLSQPDVAFEDVWVHAHTDERWLVGQVATVAAVRGVPVVRDVTMSLIPRSHIVYKIPVSPFSFEPNTADPASFPHIGSGCVGVSHDYPTTDAMSYMASACCGIAGATVAIFLAADYDAGVADDTNVVAKTVTTFGGQWAHTINLNPGDYVAVFEKVGAFGPDAFPFTVAPLPVVAPATPVSTFNSSFEF